MGADASAEIVRLLSRTCATTIGADPRLQAKGAKTIERHRLPSPSLSDCGDDQLGQPDSIGDRRRYVWKRKGPPASLPTGLPNKAASLVRVAAAAVLVERFDREAFVSRSRGNGASNEGQGDKRRKNGLHDQSPKVCFLRARLAAS